MTLIYSHIMHFAAFSSLAICLYVGAHLGKFFGYLPIVCDRAATNGRFPLLCSPFFCGSRCLPASAAATAALSLSLHIIYFIVLDDENGMPS